MSGAKTRPKTNLVHSKATGGDHFEYSEYHVLQYNDQNSALAKMTVSDGVNPSPKGEPEPARHHSKSATA